jgi:hypothetical protein
MKSARSILTGLVLLLSAASGWPSELNCHGPSNVEDFRYSWRLRGGLSWVAGFVFPTSGVGQLKTTYPKTPDQAIDSQLLITPTDGRSGFYVYQSQMDTDGEKTLMTYHGYSWGKKSRKEQTVFDYVKRLAHMRKETTEKTEDSVKPLPPETLRDVLTAIYFLRQNAATIKAPLVTTIYSDGKQYPVTFQPAGRRTFEMEEQTINAIGFEIVDAPGGKKWPGGIKVWLSDDARRIPFRIEILENFASLQLDLQSVESCAFLDSKLDTPAK